MINTPLKSNKMKKSIVFVLFLAILAISMPSCITSMHVGYLTNSAALGSANFSYIKMNAQGKSTAKYILGIGGFDKETLVNDAKQQLLSANPLKSNQALANITVNFKTAFFLMYTYHTVTCIVTADIVEFK